MALHQEFQHLNLKDDIEAFYQECKNSPELAKAAPYLKAVADFLKEAGIFNDSSKKLLIKYPKDACLVASVMRRLGPTLSDKQLKQGIYLLLIEHAEYSYLIEQGIWILFCNTKFYDQFCKEGVEVQLNYITGLAEIFRHDVFFLDKMRKLETKGLLQKEHFLSLINHPEHTASYTRGILALNDDKLANCAPCFFVNRIEFPERYYAFLQKQPQHAENIANAILLLNHYGFPCDVESPYIKGFIQKPNEAAAIVEGMKKLFLDRYHPPSPPKEAFELLIQNAPYAMAFAEAWLFFERRELLKEGEKELNIARLIQNACHADQIIKGIREFEKKREIPPFSLIKKRLPINRDFAQNLYVFLLDHAPHAEQLALGIMRLYEEGLWKIDEPFETNENIVLLVKSGENAYDVAWVLGMLSKTPLCTGIEAKSNKVYLALNAKHAKALGEAINTYTFHRFFSGDRAQENYMFLIRHAEYADKLAIGFCILKDKPEYKEFLITHAPYADKLALIISLLDKTHLFQEKSRKKNLALLAQCAPFAGNLSKVVEGLFPSILSSNSNFFNQNAQERFEFLIQQAQAMDQTFINLLNHLFRFDWFSREDFFEANVRALFRFKEFHEKIQKANIRWQEDFNELQTTILRDDKETKKTFIQEGCWSNKTPINRFFRDPLCDKNVVKELFSFLPTFDRPCEKLKKAGEEEEVKATYVSPPANHGKRKHG